MTIYLENLFDLKDLRQAIEERAVNVQTHPVLPLNIYNYAKFVPYRRLWTPVTMQCRGLIAHQYSGEVLARPLPKFFNYGEVGAPDIRLTDPVSVTDKLDGVLGVLYPTGNGEYAIATRGSFGSEFAVHANKVWKTKYADRFRPEQGVTMLFEIIYKNARIVVDYGDADDLFLLGAVDIDTGVSRGPGETASASAWPGPKAEEFHYRTLGEALAAEPRPGQEGLVVKHIASEHRLKIKQDEYKTLHRILTGVTARSLWEFLAVNACWDSARPREGKTTEGFLEANLHMDVRRIREIHAIGPDWTETVFQDVPEEFHDWVADQVGKLANAAQAAYEQLLLAYMETVEKANLGDGLHERANRYEFVKAAQATSDNWLLLMSMLDGQVVDTWCWLQAYPEAERPFRTEDAA